MKKVLAFILVIGLLVGCGIEAGKENTRDVTTDVYEGTNDNDGGDASTSQMVDDGFFLSGELVEVNDMTLLIDSEEAGLVWVSFEELPEVALNPKSIIRILFDGTIMESYPGRARGISVEVIEGFDEAFIYTLDEMESLIGDGDLTRIIEWNNRKDTVAFAQVDLSNQNEAYFIRVASLYEKGDKLVAYVENELPDLAWFYDTLQVQTGDSFMDIEPPYEVIELDNMGAEHNTDELRLDYNLIESLYMNDSNETQIAYFVLEGLKGELVMDYINQSLYGIVKEFEERESINIKAEILEQDEFLTIAYKGENTDQGYTFERYLTLDVRSATVINPETIVKDWQAFDSLFSEMTDGQVYSEQEGAMTYIEDNKLVITFVPLDDSAERLYIELDMELLAPMIDFDFEMPAS